MGKRVQPMAKHSNARMPYRAALEGDGAKKPARSWKRKQRSYVMAGLKALGAPWVGMPKSSAKINVQSV